MDPAASGVVVVTAGPSYEPLDEVRRLTNSSSGQLGIMLANRFAEEGWTVVCLLSTMAVVRGPLHQRVRCVDFGTNDELLRHFEHLAREPAAAIFHAAALCDFRVREVQGAPPGAAKISSRAGDVVMVLQPATKVIGRLRDLYPTSRLVGWKYELDGSQADAVAKGIKQTTENRTDLCILNGQGFGPGFGVLTPQGDLTPLADKPALCDWLAAWLA